MTARRQPGTRHAGLVQPVILMAPAGIFSISDGLSDLVAFALAVTLRWFAPALRGRTELAGIRLAAIFPPGRRAGKLIQIQISEYK
jgi:hypothetical protein